METFDSKRSRRPWTDRWAVRIEQAGAISLAPIDPSGSSLADKLVNASPLAAFPRALIGALRASIEAELAAPTRSEMAKKVLAARQSRQFDETDSNMLALIDPNFSERRKRTPERVRKRADKALRGLRQGKGNKSFFARPEGIASATLCALMVSVKLNWPGVTNRKAQAVCEALYAASGGDVERRGGTPNRTDGFWRDHLRAARKKWRSSILTSIIEAS